MGNKKIIASFELSLIIISAFAFPYMIAANENVFEKFDEGHKKAVEDKTLVFENAQTEKFNFGGIINLLLKELKEPMIPVVSAEALSADMGCCEFDSDGIECSTILRGDCDMGVGDFKEFASCANSPQDSCIRGCCYDIATGVYEDGIYNHSCDGDYDWVSGLCSNFPASELGCCSLGTQFLYNTRRECDIESGYRGIEKIDWNDGVGALECYENAMTYEEGACLLGNGDCSFGTKDDCGSGNFLEGVLCTNKDLDTWCGMSDNTACKPGRSEVYFKDTCNNFANVYDENKVDTQSYWNNVIDDSSSCDITSANEKTCGNCQFDAGLICSPVVDDTDRMDSGENYCRDTSCDYTDANGNVETYDNGESWCDFDGAIGKGRDTVGSKHWRYSCNQGVVEVGGCDDYRQKICVESETNGFSYATCTFNNWRECFMLNVDDEADAMTKCDDTQGCFSETFALGDNFAFTSCLPEYPAGTNLGGDGSGSCGLAKGLSCTIYREPTGGGKCEIPDGHDNTDCLSEDFADKMNKFCRSLGDCGGSANFDGTYTKNFDVDTIIPDNDNGVWDKGDAAESFGNTEIDRLKDFANYPNEKQYASVDYSDLLDAVGFSIDVDGYDVKGEDYVLAGIIGGIGGSVGEFLYAGGAFAGFGLAFAGAIIGGALGAVLGLALAEKLELNPLATALLVAGGGLVTGAGFAMLFTLSFSPVGIAILIIGAVLLLLSWLSAATQAKCEPVNVTFDCQAWAAVSNVDSCEACNGNPLKPCNEYRCASLGACELVDIEVDGKIRYGTCIEMENDGEPVIIKPLFGTLSPDSLDYKDIDDFTGFSIVSDSGCIDAHTLLMFKVSTSKRAKCRFGEWDEDFGEMKAFGIEALMFNHTIIIPIRNPSRGPDDIESWTAESVLYVKCQDHFGNENVPGYQVKLCVNGEDNGMPPEVIGALPNDNSFTGFDNLKETVKIATDEPANCKWDLDDVGYSDMSNEMACDYQYVFAEGKMGYSCEGDFNTPDGNNVYYIRCADQPFGDLADSNIMLNSYIYTLKKPDKKIKIESIKPNEDIESGTGITPIDLVVQTSGGGDYHSCMYSFSGYKTMIPISTYTEDRIHSTPLSYVSAGTHKVRINCSDETGDIVSGESEFTITHDEDDPEFTRIWQSGSILHIITDEESECVYSNVDCRYSWDDEDVKSAGDGEEHTINVVAGKTYYVKCRDEYMNGESKCLVGVQAV